MLGFFKRMFSRLFGSAAPGGPPTMPPESPDAGVREPRGRRRPGGSSAVALAEPDEHRTIDARSGGRRRRSALR